MKWFPKKRIVAGFGSAFVILLIVGVVSYKSQLKHIETSNMVIKTQTILKKLEIVLTQITNAETGQRGYIITGDERYLEPYHAAIANIGQEIKELRELIKDSPIQQSRLNALEPLLAEKLKGLKERIELQRNKGFEAAAREVQTGKGRIVMNKIRRIIVEMENDERKLLRQGMAETETNAQRNIFIIIFGSSLALILVSIAGFVAYKELILRKRAEDALKKAYYAEMEQKVEERTTELHAINESLQREITERKQIEKKLETASNEWRATFDSATDLIILLDSEMRIIKANLATAKFFSNPIKEILDKNFSQLFRVNGIPLNVYPFERIKQAKKREEAELYLPERNIWIKISVDPILDDKGNIIRYVYIIRDITGRKQAEEELRAYQGRLQSMASQLSLIEERERRRIATDLHNHISQTLAISKIKLGALRESAPTDLIKSLDEIRDLIEQIIRYTRSLTFELSSPILYDLGFEAAVEWLGEKILKEHGILFHFKNDEQPKPLNDEARVLLFQAVRELLVNIAKHAQAREANVSIQRVGDDIRINIEDDGVGFDISELDSFLKSGAFGLFSIRERLKYIEGRFEMESKPGHGSRVTIIAPLEVQKV